VLFQYIYGFCTACLSGTDRPVDLNSANRAAVYYFFSMNGLLDGNPAVSVTSWPRAMLRLYWSLRPRKVGKYNYVPDFRGVVALGPTSFIPSDGTVGVNVYTIQSPTPDATNFLPISNVSVTAADDTALSIWHANHAERLDLVPIIGSEKLDCKDASAFSFDPNGLNPLTAIPSIVNGIQIVSIVGFNASTYYYMTSDSTSANETRQGDKDLAKLRLCTLFPTAGTPIVPNQRRTKYTTECLTLPGTLGYKHAVGKLGKDPQLKLVPGLGAINHIISKLEAFGVATRLGAGWTNSFSQSDIIYLGYLLWKRHTRRYAGSTVGARIWNMNGISLLEADPSEVHIDDASIDILKLPENIVRAISSQSIFNDNDGALLPLAARIDVSLIATPVLTYSGTASYPTVTYTSLTQCTGVNNADLLSKLKALENSIAQYTNLVYPVFVGSMLDTTILRNIYNTGASTLVSGVVSRRALTGPFLAKVMSQIPLVSYTTSNAQKVTTVTDTQSSNTIYDHTYKQKNRKDFSGYDSMTTLTKMCVTDGLVQPGNLTANIAGNKGPDFNLPPSPLGAPRERLFEGRDLPQTMKSSMYKLAARLVPRKGKYCGPGWTAGVETAVTDPYLGTHGYRVPPTDDEDAICKMHDEDYGRAVNSADIQRADRKMVERLDKLSEEKGLSLYGYAARFAIGIKGADTHDDL